jgi:hypothetical protein
MWYLWTVAKRTFPAALVVAVILAFFDIAGVHGMAPFRPRPFEDIYRRFPIFLAVCWLFFLVAAFLRSPKDSS